MKKELPKSETQVWVIRPGTLESGDTTDEFLKCNAVGLEDSGMGDLTELPSDREAYYRKYSESHPGDTKVSIAGIGGKFFCFVHEIAIGDTVLVPSRKDRNIYVGEILGEYTYDETVELFPHERQVEWRYVFAKALLSVVAQRELGAARTLFRIKKNHREISALIQQGKAQPFMPKRK